MKLRAEFAKSSRARCRACGQFIEGGTIRWAKENEEDDVRPQYTHLSCLNLGRGTRENIKEDDIIFDGDFTSKQHDAIIEAFHLTAEEKPEDRRMQAIQRHEVAPEKRKDKPEFMVDEEENEDEEEGKEPEAQGNGDEDEEDEDYIEEDAKADEKEEEDEDEYMEDNEIAADVEELKAEASKLQHPNKRRRKNEAKEPDEESGKQMQGSRRRGSRKRSERAGKEQETRQESDEETEEQKGDDKEGVKTSSRDKMKGNKSSEVKSERIRRKYQIMGSDELKEYLRANKQIMSGNQEDMMKRCIDCEMYGALPTCPQCQKGRLIKNEDTGRVECHGYYDEDAGMPARCGFNEDEKKIERRQWREPSEAPPVLFNVHIKGEEGPASLTAEVKKRLDSIVGSQNLSKREMSKELLKYGRQCDLDLPSDDSEAIDAIEEHLDDNNENGKIDYEAAFAEIAREYSKDPEIKGIRRSKSKFEKNEEIAGMLNELATLYGKLGGQDRFRARAEKKSSRGDSKS